MSRLERGFFARPAPVVAPDLVGKLLIAAAGGLVARLVEVEAYMQDDPACHAYGRRTPRLEPLYGPPGHAYVYFTFGMHWCANVSTGVDGVAEGCLLRAAEPISGLEVMRGRRGERVADRDLLRGPARLAAAFGLSREDSGRDLCDGGPLRFADDGCRPEVETGPRVGVAAAADTAWRFMIAGSPWVSPYKRHRLAR
ncbi:MAG: DNA-3-methyladenine glycosylase [Egibacteraceae bacterium]